MEILGDTEDGPPIVVIGAGAAGLMAAISSAAAGGGPVLILERTRDGGRKILISGGGRCNVLPSHLDPRDFVTTSSPHTLRKLLLDWPLVEQRRFFEEELRIPLKLEPDTGKLFPVSDRARDVRDGLIQRARELGVRLRFEAVVLDLSPPTLHHPSWLVHLSGGETLAARRIVLASGGLSVPATGSDGTGIGILTRLGHSMNPLYPALTPLLADPPVHRDLAGVSLDVTLEAPRAGTLGRRRSRGGFLFTHRGYSGPAVLDLSHLATLAGREGTERPLLVRWSHAPASEWDERLREEPGRRLRSAVREVLPVRLADRLIEESGVPHYLPLAQLRKEDRRRLATLLGAYPLPWTGDEGYRKAEVTGGGIDLGEVHPRSLESRRHPGLHLCGELLDAFGPIGGHNFAWAWSTGRRAGLGAAQGGRPRLDPL